MLCGPRIGTSNNLGCVANNEAPRPIRDDLTTRVAITDLSLPSHANKCLLELCHADGIILDFG
jgi:hypothetical protein